MPASGAGAGYWVLEYFWGCPLLLPTLTAKGAREDW